MKNGRVIFQAYLTCWECRAVSIPGTEFLTARLLGLRDLLRSTVLEVATIAWANFCLDILTSDAIDHALPLDERS